MKKFLFFLIIIILAGAGIFFGLKRSKTSVYNQTPVSPDTSIATGPMQIISPAFEPNQTIPAKYTCDGDNINPPLQFSNVPAEAKSLALVVYDPDAPGGDWTHWLVWDISPATTGILEGKVPVEATEGTTSFGQTGFGGPCPPPGSAHHYHFKLYALSAKLNLPSRTTKTDLEASIKDITIGSADLVGIYQRN